MKKFNFGINWKEYSKNVLDVTRLENAQQSLRDLIPISLEGRSFLDVGCGSGLFSIAAHRLGASPVLGTDLSRESIEASQKNQKKFHVSGATFLQKDIFDLDVQELGAYDIVYCWGVVHHTGDMYRAIEKLVPHVKRSGTLVLAIYNRHWTSPIWKIVKRTYLLMPRWGQWVMVWGYYAALRVAYALFHGGEAQDQRGMDIYYDAIDWLGGYPYEYASRNQIISYVKRMGFSLEKTIPRDGTGNNEFVFMRSPTF